MCGYCQSVVPMRAAPVQHDAPAVAAAKTAVPKAVWIVAAAFVVILLGGIVTLATLANSSRSAPGGTAPAATRAATVDEIAKLDLAITPQQLAERFGVTVRDNRLHVELRGGRFESVGFFWNQAHLEHVSMVSLSPLKTGIPADVLERSRAQLGRALQPAATGGHQYNGEGVGFSIGSNVSIVANGFDDPRWKGRLSALFTVLKGAGLGTSDALDERTKRDVLNLGYPLARLAEVDFDVPLEAAEREVHRVIPGAVSAGERHDVGLGHPWFGNAMILWENEARGKFAQINVSYASTFDFKAQREELEHCLKLAFGTPKVRTSNHLAGEVTLTFDSDPKLPWVYVSNQSVMIRSARQQTDGKAGARKALKVLAGCG
jgi:hypothetical protein